LSAVVIMVIRVQKIIVRATIIDPFNSLFNSHERDILDGVFLRIG